MGACLILIRVSRPGLRESDSGDERDLKWRTALLGVLVLVKLPQVGNSGSDRLQLIG